MKYFTIEELTKTSHGENTPNKDQIHNLKLLVERVLDPAREELGRPITVTSGFRSERVNKIVNGAVNSQHMTGQAADIRCYDNKILFKIISDMEFDQLIWEFGDENNPAWVHVSFSEYGNRNQTLKAFKSKSKTIYKTI